MRYELMTNDTWMESNEEELIAIRSFFPESIIRVTDNGEDVTKRFIKTTRCIFLG